MRLLKWTALGLVLGGALAAPAAAGPPMDWTTAFTWEAGATPTLSPPGGEFKEVGIINSFDSPFGDLNGNDPTREYTFYVHDLFSLGTVATGSPLTIYETHYVSGFIEIYCDTTPDASYDPGPPNPGVPADFTDGTLLLAGKFNSFWTQSNNFTTNKTGNLEGDITWTGGSLYSRVSGCTAIFTGGITWKPSVMIPGYVFRHDGNITLNCPVPERPSTWGKIKSMYH